MNTAFAIVNGDAYPVACPSCHVVSDLAQALFCDCLSKERTPVCGSCGGCFCKLTGAKRHEFWDAAPASIQAQRLRKPLVQAVPPLAAPKAPLVMLVDDDEEIRAIGAHVISRYGFRCVTAANGPEALGLMALEEPALVITDALMPKMDGRELCRFVKRSSAAKVLIMTSLYTAPRYKYEAYKQFGADEYLAKPIDFAVLETALHRLVPARTAAR
jgi:CheY-like chemotaxis protein